MITMLQKLLLKRKRKNRSVKLKNRKVSFQALFSSHTFSHISLMTTTFKCRLRKQHMNQGKQNKIVMQK